jgi:hypothetical protein
MGNVTPLHPSVPSSDPIAVWGEALVSQKIEPGDIPGPIMRQVMDWLADEVRQARFAARAAIDAIKPDRG